MIPAILFYALLAGQAVAGPLYPRNVVTVTQVVTHVVTAKPSPVHATSKARSDTSRKLHKHPQPSVFGAYFYRSPKQDDGDFDAIYHGSPPPLKARGVDSCDDMEHPKPQNALHQGGDTTTLRAYTDLPGIVESSMATKAPLRSPATTTLEAYGDKIPGHAGASSIATRFKPSNSTTIKTVTETKTINATVTAPGPSKVTATRRPAPESATSRPIAEEPNPQESNATSRHVPPRPTSQSVSATSRTAPKSEKPTSTAEPPKPSTSQPLSLPTTVAPTSTFTNPWDALKPTYAPKEKPSHNPWDDLKPPPKCGPHVPPGVTCYIQPGA